MRHIPRGVIPRKYCSRYYGFFNSKQSSTLYSEDLQGSCTIVVLIYNQSFRVLRGVNAESVKHLLAQDEQ